MTSYRRSAVETSPSSSGGDEPVVIFFTDNGKGLGHVTRMLAVARRAHGRFRPFFLTLSLGYQVLRRMGVPAEFFPPYHHLGLTKDEWAPLLMMRIAEAVEVTGARAVVVDHVSPPKAFDELRRRMSGVELIWSRRGLWRPGTNRGAAALAAAFDRVVEPGDLAAPIDIGGSTRQRAGIHPIGPVVIVDADERPSRREARRRLGLPDDGRVLLLNLSAPDTAALVALLKRVRDVVRSVADGEPVHLFAPLHPLHDDSLASVEGVTFAPVYPVAEYLEAFDGAVSSAGYNSFHELVASHLPVVFLAHSQTNVDDQQRRARFAMLSGRGHWVESIDDPRFADVIRRILRPVEPSIARDVAEILGEPTGAEEFADLLGETLDRKASEGLQIAPWPWDERDRLSLSGKISGGEGDVVVVDARHLSDAELAGCIDELGSARDANLRVVPIFFIDRGSPRPLVANGIAFESVMSAREWMDLGVVPEYEEYVRGRLEAAVSRYGAADVVPLQPGKSLVASLRAIGAGLAVSPRPGPAVERRAYRLALPVRDGRGRSFLEIDLPSHLYVPRLLERDGLAGYEATSLACWLTILELDAPGAAFDVGANVGPYAWLASALTERPVIAFEPVSDLVAAIRTVAEKNGLDIRVEEVAVGDRDGKAELHLSDQTDSSHSLREGFRRSSRSVQVDVRTLDSYVAANPDRVPHVLKIDTETTEPEVLAGAHRTLEIHRPWLIVEVLAGRSEESLAGQLGGLGYHWYRIDDYPPFERRSVITGDPKHEHLNWLFAPTEPDDRFWAEVRSWQDALRSCRPGPA